MAEIPGVPNLQTVDKPYLDSRKSGQVGQTISDAGDVGLDITNHIREAQKQVDSLAARNDLNAAYAATQDQLLKTQNSRDVEGVIKQGQDTLQDVAAKWSGSPAAVGIQMDAQSLQPGLTHVGTVRQVDLMTKEGKIQLTQQGQVLAGDYAGARAAGDGKGEQAALDGYTTAVNGLVKTGLMGDVEAKDTIREFRKSGQELQIKNAISNPDPAVNQKAFDDINAHPEMFPDVPKEALDTYKGQALAAQESHVRYKDWADGQVAQNTMLRPLINQHTNPATGQFDEGKALEDIAGQFKDGKITAIQQGILEDGVKSQAADLQVGLKKQADAKLDAVENLLSKHQFGPAAAELGKDQHWFEENGFGQDYRAALTYTKTREAEARSEARYDYAFNREVNEDHSQDQLGKVQHFIANGGILTKSDIYGMAGMGKGKMATKDVDAAWNMMNAYQKEPDYAAAANLISNIFTLPKTATAEQVSVSNRKEAQTLALFQQQVNAHPEQSKQEIANNIIKSQAETDISAKADQMFGSGPSKSGGFLNTLKQMFTSTEDSNKDTPAQPKDGDTKTNAAGDHLVYTGGKWQLAPSK